MCLTASEKASEVAGAFFPETEFAAGDSPFALTAADFDGDGHVDLAVTNTLSDDVALLRGTDGGGFVPGGRLGPVQNSFSILSADLDNDGHVDLLAADVSDRVVGFFGAGDGTFPTEVSFLPDSSAPVALALHDFDADGLPDLAVADSVNREVSILRGDGAGAFVLHHRLGVGMEPRILAVADFDGNGILDIAVAGDVRRRELVFLPGEKGGVFRVGARLVLPVLPRDLAVIDFGGDGRADLAVSSSDDDEQGPGGVSIFSILEDGSILHRLELSGLPSAAGVAVADFNGDSREDLAVVNRLAHEVQILLATGNSGFTALSSIGVGTFPYEVIAAHLDHDSYVDLAVANSFTDDISILRGLPGGDFIGRRSQHVDPSPGAVVSVDLDQDGRRDLVAGSPFTPHLFTLMGTGTGEFSTQVRTDMPTSLSQLAPGDFNDDGLPDIAVTAVRSGRPVVFSLLGDGKGGLQPTPVVTGIGGINRSFTSPGSGHFDGDRFEDLVALDRSVIVSPASPSEVVVLFGDGRGGLRSIRRLPIDSPRDLSVADFDRDGLIDFVVVGGADSVQIFISRGDGLFLTRVTAIPGPQRAVVSPDVDSDGLPDLVLLGEVPEVTVLRNTGSGQFEMVASYAVEPESRSLGAADFDLDGHADIAVTDPVGNPLVIGDGTLSLLLGRGDGTFTPAAVLRTKSPGTVIPGDFNGDGRVDIATRTDGALTLLLNQAPYPWRNPLQGQPPGINDFLGAAAVVTYPGGAPQIVETPHPILAGDVSRATLVLSLGAQVLAGGDGRVGTVDDTDLRDTLQVRVSGTDLALRYLSPGTVAIDLPPDLTDLDLLLSVFGVELGTSRIRRDVDGLHIAR